MTTIVKVESRPNGFFRITDAEGVRYMTKNGFAASLLDQYRKSGTRVEIQSAAGWWYRDLRAIKPEGGELLVA